MIRAFLLMLLLSSMARAGGITAHIGCWSSLGSERVCAGNTFNCINTAQSDLSATFDSLLVGYQVNNEIVPPTEQMGRPTTIRLPLSNMFGLLIRPFYVTHTKPDGEMDTVYLIDTDQSDIGTLHLNAAAKGTVDLVPGFTGTWTAQYGLNILVEDCSGVSLFAFQWRQQKHHHQRRIRLHPMQVRISS